MRIRAGRKLYAALCLLGIVLLLRPAITGWVVSWRWYPYDGRVDWIVARAFLAGINPYSPEALRSVGIPSLGHPPTTGLWMLPFAAFDLADMSAVYGHVVLILLFGMLIMVSRELRWPWPTLTAALLFLAVTATGWFRYSLMVAQIGALIAIAFMGAWLLLRRGQDIGAGIVLGLACTIKLHPGLLVLFLVLSRRYRAAASAVAVYLAVAALMTWRFGVVAWQQYSHAEGPVMRLWAGSVHNASLYAVVLRVLTPSCQGSGVPTPGVSGLVAVIGFALCAVAYWLMRRAPRGRSSLDLSYALFVVLAVFLNPFVFEHYFLQLILPFLIAVAELGSARRRGVSMAWVSALGFTLLVIAGMYAIDPFTKDAFNRRDSHIRLHLYEVANWLHVVLLAGTLATLLILVIKHSRSPSVLDPPPGRLPRAS